MSYFKSIRKGANLNYDKKILDIIKNEVATYYHIPIEYLNRRITRDERKKNVTNARQMAIYLSIELQQVQEHLLYIFLLIFLSILVIMTKIWR